MLVDQLKITHADVFTFYLKTHFYHWNIEGPNFPQYHEFLGNLYQDVFESADAIAELIRTLDTYAPGTLTRIKALTNIEESDVVPDARTMMSNLFIENLKLLVSLNSSYDLAESESKYGISNFIQDRIQAHEKHGWMLKSILK